MINVVKLQCDDQGPSLLCMNEVLGQLGEIGEIEQEGSNAKVQTSPYFTRTDNMAFTQFYALTFSQVQCLAACEDQINQISISQSRMPNR